MEAAVVKAIREAKLESSWAAPNADYEDAALGFLGDALDVSRSNAFLDSFLPLQERVARLGMVNRHVRNRLWPGASPIADRAGTLP